MSGRRRAGGRAGARRPPQTAGLSRCERAKGRALRSTCVSRPTPSNRQRRGGRARIAHQRGFGRPGTPGPKGAGRRVVAAARLHRPWAGPCRRGSAPTLPPRESIHTDADLVWPGSRMRSVSTPLEHRLSRGGSVCSHPEKLPGKASSLPNEHLPSPGSASLKHRERAAGGRGARAIKQAQGLQNRRI
jgi:hypothetical protein